MLKLPDLPYAYDALEPHMSAKTLELHHDKHHAGYVDKANGTIDWSDVADEPLADLVRATHKTDQGLFNNVAQHYNHTHFWELMTPGGNDKVPDVLANRLKAAFGSVGTFKEEFKSAATGLFGSGWCWLAEKKGELEIMALPNAENPLIYGALPLMGLDVWEHAYYLDHFNERGKYVDTFLNELVNWQYVTDQF